MAYDAVNLSLDGGIRSGAWNRWVYRSADTFTTVKASGYLATAYAMGVRAGDQITVVDTASTPVITIALILTCTSAPACTMSQTGVVP